MIRKKIGLHANNEEIVLEIYLHSNLDTKYPAMVICPGGAYFKIAETEAEPVALKWFELGFNTFVLRYSCVASGSVDWPNPMLDLARSLELIRKNADIWSVESSKVIVCGFSAGGHLAVSYGNHWHEEFFSKELNTTKENLKPNAIVACYPSIEYTIIDKEWRADLKSDLIHPLMGIPINEIWENHYLALMGTKKPTMEQLEKHNNSNFINANTPPTFLWHTTDDELVSVKNTLHYAQGLLNKNIIFDLHIFQGGSHGLSLCSDEDLNTKHISTWIDLVDTWFKSIGLGK